MRDVTVTPIEQVEMGLEGKGYTSIKRFETSNVEGTVAFHLWCKGMVYVLEQEFVDGSFTLWVESGGSYDLERTVEELP